MIRTLKVMLCPNNKQNTKLFECAGVARFAYNWALGYQQLNYEIGNDFISDYDLRKVLTQLKATNPKFVWLNCYSNNIAKQAIKDACKAYISFFKGTTKYPKFKSKRKTKPSFYVDSVRIHFTDTHVILEKLTESRKKNKQKFNAVRLAEKGRIPLNAKYVNPRISFDGLHWWLTVGVEYIAETMSNTNECIGIDIGIKNLAICSDKYTYPSINKTKAVKQAKRKQRRLQRKISRKYLKTRKGGVTVKQRIL